MQFRVSTRLRLEDTKRIMSPEMRPKSFGTRNGPLDNKQAVVAVAVDFSNEKSEFALTQKGAY